MQRTGDPRDAEGLPRRQGKTPVFLRTLRKLHAWVGLCGAAFGLLFGLTGFLMAHRDVMKIPAGEIQEHIITVDLPEAPATPEALAQVLAARFNLPLSRLSTRVKPARTGTLGGAKVTASEQWTLQITGHAHYARATYVPGNHSVEVEQRDASLLAALMRLHKNDGAQAGWILFTDAFAFALVFLALSGTLLWTRLGGSRFLAAGLALGTALVAVLIALRAW